LILFAYCQGVVNKTHLMTNIRQDLQIQIREANENMQ
jgi:hypothetical protein